MSGYENTLPAAVLSQALGESSLPADEASSEPVFSLGRVQYSPPSVIKRLQVQNNLLLLLTESSIVLINLATPSDEESLPPPWMPGTKPPLPEQVHVFCDFQAFHVIFSVHATGENFYLALKPPAGKPKQLKPLPKLRGLHITSIAFSPSQHAAKDPLSTGDMLLGTSDGRIIATCLDAQESRGLPFRNTERYHRQLNLSLEETPITGLRYLLWSKRVGLIVATESKVRQYVARVSGNQDPFEAVEKTFREGAATPKTMELPADQPTASTLHWSGETVTTLGQPRTVAWLAGPGIYHGAVLLGSQEAGDGLIENAQLVPYPSTSQSDHAETPVSMALTPFHFILLYLDRIRVIRILDDKLVYDELMDISDSEKGTSPFSIVKDELKGTYWLYTKSTIFEVTVNQESREMWRVHLRKGAHEAALSFAQTPRQRDIIKRAQADSFMAQNRIMQAADLYAQTSQSFEEVVLMLSGNEDALRMYLSAKLQSLPKSDLSARMALSTWLLATYLAKLNTLEDATVSESDQELKGNIELEAQMIDEDVRTFMCNHKENFDRRTTLELIRSHGRADILLEFARLIADHSLILQHYVDEEDWTNALKALAVCPDLDLYYQHAHELLSNAPRDTVQQLMRRPELDTTRLLPSILLPSHPEAYKHIKHYLTWSVEHGATDSSIHNTLLWLHVEDNSELSYLEGENAGYDLEHALRLCLAAKRPQACAVIYGKMGMFESAVDLALEVGDLDLAKTYADRAIEQDDEFLRKKLWRKIAGKLVNDKHDIQEAMRFLETDALKIEDILPFFPDFVLIDSFKDDICEALESYAGQIEDLKREMNEATASAELIKRDISELSHRLVVVDSADKCCICQNLLLKRQFYVFPCGHSFHADCLIQEVTQHLSATQLKRVLQLQERLRRVQRSLPAPTASTQPGESEAGGLLKPLPFARNKLTAASLQSIDQLRKLVLPDALVGAIGAGIEGMKIWSEATEKEVSPQQTDELEKVRSALDDILASSCVWCERGIAAIDHGFLEEGEEELE